MLRAENGITLVALIITIIVLIILAAVTIGSILDHNMIDKTVKATEKYGGEQINEEQLMNKIYNLVTNVEGNLDAKGLTSK